MRFYVLLDTSGSMEGAKIGALNDAMANILAELKQISYSTNQRIDLAVLSFGKETKWMYNHPLKVEEFIWCRLSACGMTPLGKACVELNVDLMSDNLKSGDKIYIIIISDGCPTDDYDEGIDALLANPHFINANKFAIAIGDNADISALSRFVELDSHIYIQNKADKLLDALQDIIYSVDKTPHYSYPIIENEEDDWS